MSYQAFVEAVERAGSQSALAAATGMSQQRISSRLKKRMGVPAEFVLKVESATGVSRHVQRPDLYPLLDEVAQARAMVPCDRSMISQAAK